MRTAVLMRALLCCVALIVACMSEAVAENPPQANEIFDLLMKDGVVLSSGAKESLPKPVMADGLNFVAQQKVIEGLVEQQWLAEFRRGRRPDRHELKITGTPAKAADQIGVRHLDLYYIANGKLETVADKNFIKEIMAAGQNKFHFLTVPELVARQRTPPEDSEIKRERLAHAKLDLFNMVKVGGTGRGISTFEKDSLLTAFTLDDEFQKDKEFPNEWQTIKLDKKNGKKVFSDPEVYRGFGGYMKVTRLAGTPQPQVFIEYHLAFEEPFEWFSGGGSLVKNLHEQVRADVRSFRGDLQKYEQ